MQRANGVRPIVYFLFHLFDQQWRMARTDQRSSVTRVRVRWRLHSIRTKQVPRGTIFLQTPIRAIPPPTILSKIATFTSCRLLLFSNGIADLQFCSLAWLPQQTKPPTRRHSMRRARDSSFSERGTTDLAIFGLAVCYIPAGPDVGC